MPVIKITILFMIGILFGFYMLYRNELVFRTRMRIAHEIHEINIGLILSGKPVDETFHAAFEKYSYTKMVFQLLKFNWTLEEIRGKDPTTDKTLRVQRFSTTSE